MSEDDQSLRFGVGVQENDTENDDECESGLSGTVSFLSSEFVSNESQSRILQHSNATADVDHGNKNHHHYVGDDDGGEMGSMASMGVSMNLNESVISSSILNMEQQSNSDREYETEDDTEVNITKTNAHNTNTSTRNTNTNIKTKNTNQSKHEEGQGKWIDADSVTDSLQNFTDQKSILSHFQQIYNTEKQKNAKANEKKRRNLNRNVMNIYNNEHNNEHNNNNNNNNNHNHSRNGLQQRKRRRKIGKRCFSVSPNPYKRGRNNNNNNNRNGSTNKRGTDNSSDTDDSNRHSTNIENKARHSIVCHRNGSPIFSMESIHTRRQMKREFMEDRIKSEQEREEITQCTFKPDIQSSQKHKSCLHRKNKDFVQIMDEDIHQRKENFVNLDEKIFKEHHTFQPKLNENTQHIVNERPSSSSHNVFERLSLSPKSPKFNINKFKHLRHKMHVNHNHESNHNQHNSNRNHRRIISRTPTAHDLGYNKHHCGAESIDNHRNGNPDNRVGPQRIQEISQRLYGNHGKIQAKKLLYKQNMLSREHELRTGSKVLPHSRKLIINAFLRDLQSVLQQYLPKQRSTSISNSADFNPYLFGYLPENPANATATATATATKTKANTKSNSKTKSKTNVKAANANANANADASVNIPSKTNFTFEQIEQALSELGFGEQITRSNGHNNSRGGGGGGVLAKTNNKKRKKMIQSKFVKKLFLKLEKHNDEKRAALNQQNASTTAETVLDTIKNVSGSVFKNITICWGQLRKFIVEIVSHSNNGSNKELYQMMRNLYTRKLLQSKNCKTIQNNNQEMNNMHQNKKQQQKMLALKKSNVNRKKLFLQRREEEIRRREKKFRKNQEIKEKLALERKAKEFEKCTFVPHTNKNDNNNNSGDKNEEASKSVPRFEILYEDALNRSSKLHQRQMDLQLEEDVFFKNIAFHPQTNSKADKTTVNNNNNCMKLKKKNSGSTADICGYDKSVLRMSEGRIRAKAQEIEQKYKEKKLTLAWQKRMKYLKEQKKIRQEIQCMQQLQQQQRHSRSPQQQQQQQQQQQPSPTATAEAESGDSHSNSNTNTMSVSDDDGTTLNAYSSVRSASISSSMHSDSIIVDGIDDDDSGIIGVDVERDLHIKYATATAAFTAVDDSSITNKNKKNNIDNNKANAETANEDGSSLSQSSKAFDQKIVLKSNHRIFQTQTQTESQSQSQSQVPTRSQTLDTEIEEDTDITSVSVPVV